MCQNIKLNNIIEKNDQKLRPLKLLFKIQFGQNLRFRNKLIKNWIGNTIKYKTRRQIGYVKTPHPRYHYKRIRPSLKFYRFVFLKFKSCKFLKINFFSRNFILFKNISKKKINSRLMLMPYLKKKKKKFVSIKKKKRDKFFFKNKRYLIQQRNMKIREKQLKQKKNEYFSKIIRLKSLQPKYYLRGKIFFANSWITVFHKFNLEKLNRTVSEKNFFKSDLKKFIKFWKNVLNQKIFCIYSLYSFYVFKSVFLKKRKSERVFFYNKENTFLISISYNHFSFFINLLHILKLFFNERLFLSEKVFKLYKKYDIIKFINKKKFSPNNFNFLTNQIKIIDEQLDNLLKIRKLKKKNFLSLKIKLKEKKQIKPETENKDDEEDKPKRKPDFFKFKTKTFFHIFYLYCFLINLKKNFFSDLNHLNVLKKQVFFISLFTRISIDDLEKMSFFNFLLKNNLSITSDFSSQQKYFLNAISTMKLKKTNFDEVSDFFRNTILNFFSEKKIKLLSFDSVNQISFILNKLIDKNKYRKNWKVFFVLKKKQKNTEFDFKKRYLRHLYLWLFLKNSFNKKIYRKLFNPYNVWLFFINYALNYYLFSKLYFVFLNYLFYILFQKFNKVSNILKLNKLEFCYDFLKSNDNSRYHLGIRPRTFVTTFNRRVKKGLL